MPLNTPGWGWGGWKEEEGMAGQGIMEEDDVLSHLWVCGLSAGC